MKILGIESSADETCAAIVEDGHKLLSNVIASSLDLHNIYGGIVPEIASRSHLEIIVPVIAEALEVAKTDWDDIDAIAVTQGPGLSGSLLICNLTARSLAIAKNKPLYPVNHVLAHTYANFITSTSLPGYQLNGSTPQFPFLALIVSGGHSQIMLYKNHGDYKILGQTRDDAVGEAFDKVAKILGLPYPGGPSVAKSAKQGESKAVKLPKSRLDNPYDFSFSGIKTAVLRAAQAACGKSFDFPSVQLPGLLNDQQKADLAASFQSTAVETLIDALEKACDEFKPACVLIGGGVAANQALREEAASRIRLPLLYPDMKLCTDNAAMIAALTYFKAQKEAPVTPYKLEVIPTS
jgi:N6-L-threonylcarbamoyladenine synthase